MGGEKIKTKTKKLSIPRTFFIIFAAVLIVCTLQTSFAANITIDEDSEGGIRGAITNATLNPGETVFLTPGTYNKTGNDTNFTINKNVTIEGNGSTEDVIIDAQGLSRIFTISNSSKVIFINITFINGNTTLSGGAIYGGVNTQLTFINCAFIDNNANNNGGAIYTVGNNVILDNCTFINNTASDGFGGAIAINNATANLLLTDCDFDNNIAGTNGGGIYTIGDYISLTNCTFTINSANTTNFYAGGGAIYSSASIDVIDCIFNGNIANNRRAGAIFSAGDLTISNSNFINNRAGNSGGAIFSAGDLTISNSNFTNNGADNVGGVISCEANIIISNSSFINNIAGTSGGAIYNAENAHSSLNNCTFINNSANTTTIGGGGGAIYTDSSIDVIDCIFNGNIANNRRAGAIYSTGDLTVKNTNFTNNVAGTEGGAIFSRLNVIMSNSTFINNIAGTYGGVIYNNAILTIFGNTMAGNTAGTLGNAIYNNGTINGLVLSYGNYKVGLGDTVTIEATLTDDNGNLVSGGDINFYIGGVSIGTELSKEGKATASYKTTNLGIIPVTGSYSGSTASGIISISGQIEVVDNTVNPNIIPYPSINNTANETTNTENSTNDTNNDNPITAKATAMKNTGIPITIILFVLLASLSLITRRK